MPATAALNAVPFPFTRPVTVVDSVIAGVVVAVATVPAKPLAETTEALVTVPEPPPPPPLFDTAFNPMIKPLLQC